MATLTENAPIIFILFDNFVPINTVIMDAGLGIKPQNINIIRSARGAVFNTAEAAFLNDYGEGYATINISGNTGFGGEFGKGFQQFKNLELMFSSYLAARENTALPNGTNAFNGINLLYIDTLNAEAFSCYPLRFTLTRSSQSNPHLYYYNISLIALYDMLENPIFKLEGQLTNGTIGTQVLGGVATGLQAIISLFANITKFSF